MPGSGYSCHLLCDWGGSEPVCAPAPLETGEQEAEHQPLEVLTRLSNGRVSHQASLRGPHEGPCSTRGHLEEGGARAAMGNRRGLSDLQAQKDSAIGGRDAITELTCEGQAGERRGPSRTSELTLAFG